MYSLLSLKVLTEDQLHLQEVEGYQLLPTPYSALEYVFRPYQATVHRDIRPVLHTVDCLRKPK